MPQTVPVVVMHLFDTMHYGTSLTEVCHTCSVGTEPGLQSLSGEFLKYKTANDADMLCRHCCRELLVSYNRQKSYLDVKVFNPFAKNYVKESLTQCYRRLEMDKKRAYEARVREVELDVSHNWCILLLVD